MRRPVRRRRPAARRGAGAAAVLALIGGAGAAAVASAQEPAPDQSSVIVRDPAGDVRSKLDLTRLTLGRAADGRLVSVLTLATPWADGDLLADAGPPGSLCLRLWTVSVPPDQPPDYLVCVTADKDGALRGSVLRERANALPQKVAAAAVSRRSERTITVRFSQTSIGRPAALQVAAEASRPNCLRVTCIDGAPDAPSVRRMELRKPADGSGS